MATLVCPENFNANEDAEVVRTAIKGWGTDEKTIISILGRRNADQRKQIRGVYEGLYEEDLIKRLESETTGDFESALYRWILYPNDREAVLANVAIKKKSDIDYNVIIEIACVHSPEELLAVRRAYQHRYKHSLEEDIAAQTEGDMRKLLLALVTAYRYDGDEINAKFAKSESDIIQDAIKDKKFNDEELFRILSTRSKKQLMATFNKFREDQGGKTISKALLNEKADDLEKALHTVIRCINDPKKYFEKVLRNALNQRGTDENTLTRVIVTRAEKDLKDIMEIYYKKNSVSLEDAVAKETSGHYKAFLLTLLGKGN